MAAVIALVAPDGYAPARPSELKDLAAIRRSVWWLAGLVAVGVLGAAIPPFSVPAGVIVLVLTLSFPGGDSRRLRVAVAFAALGTLIGLVRFATSKAMLGIVESGQSITATTALSKLREVVTAEDAVRRTAAWDPDHDGIGSAALVGALAGAIPMRAGASPTPAVLNQDFRETVETKIGPAALVDGYLFVVCLPTPSGGFTARPETPVDDEFAERRFVAYAWPSDLASGMNVAFFADEHERLSYIEAPRGSAPPFVGATRPPSCDAALGDGAAEWKPWKNKKPREHLPGDPR